MYAFRSVHGTCILSDRSLQLRLQNADCPGCVQQVGGDATRSTASFLIGDITYTFSGTNDPSVQPFESLNATLEYDDVGQLTETGASKVGAGDVMINLSNGSKMSGPLNLPIPASRIGGSGSWTQTFRRSAWLG